MAHFKMRNLSTSIGHPYVQITLPLVWSLVLLLVSAGTHAFAEGPRVVGEFKRSDGVAVKAIEFEVDGVIARGGVMCWFDLSDGTQTKLSRPNNSRSCIVRTKDSTAEIYWYQSDLLPVANRVERFDGYTFIDITTPSRRWLSPLIHTSRHLLSYIVTIALFLFPLKFGVDALKTISKVGRGRVFRVFWIVLGVFFALFYSLICTMYSAVSPPIFLALLALTIVMYWQIKKFTQR